MNGDWKSPVTIKYIAREVKVYSLTKDEMQDLRSNQGTLEFGFACTTGGVFMAFLITVLTVSASSLLNGFFYAMVGTTGLLTLYFGAKARAQQIRAEKSFQAMLERDAEVRPIRSRAGA